MNTWCLPAVDKRHAVLVRDVSAAWLSPRTGGYRDLQATPSGFSSPRTLSPLPKRSVRTTALPPPGAAKASAGRQLAPPHRSHGLSGTPRISPRRIFGVA
jgi:hypothetical protein